MKPSLADVRAEAEQHLSAIHTLCVRDSKILVVVVFPDQPQQNWMLGDATIDEAIEGLRFLAQEGEEMAYSQQAQMPTANGVSAAAEED